MTRRISKTDFSSDARPEQDCPLVLTLKLNRTNNNRSRGRGIGQ